MRPPKNRIYAKMDFWSIYVEEIFRQASLNKNSRTNILPWPLLMDHFCTLLTISNG